jgi:hypothetical protein
MSAPHTVDKRGQLNFYVLILAGLVGLVGYYGPWVPHRAAGLVVLGLDLAEFVKFLPQVASGQVNVQREIFYLPLFVASVSASLLASRHCLPKLVRWVLAMSAIPLALAMLPPAWSPSVLSLPEFRLQTLGIGFCLILIPAIPVLRYLPDRVVLGVIALLALIAAVGPAWAFLQVRFPISQLYRHPLPLGWGFWITLSGFLALSLFATADILRPRGSAKGTK